MSVNCYLASVTIGGKTYPVNGFVTLSLGPRQVERSPLADLGSQLAAQILLSDTTRRIVVPSKEEWVGVGLLEMNDELGR